MPRLILFELKKMLSRRVALAANVGVIMVLVAIMALNVVQTKTANAGARSSPAPRRSRRCAPTPRSTRAR